MMIAKFDEIARIGEQCQNIHILRTYYGSQSLLPLINYAYSALPNKRNGTLIIFCKIGNAVRSLLGAVW